LAVRVTAKDLGAVCDGVADDGAILTAAIANHFGTVGTGPRLTPVEIDMGDLTYNLDSPIQIYQSYIKLIGSPRLQCNNIVSAVMIHLAGAVAIIYGTEIDVTVLGTVTGDAIYLQGGSQCKVQVRNMGVVGGYLSHAQACYSCHFICYHDDEAGSVQGIHRETSLYAGANCLNSNIYAFGYYCTGTGVSLSESQFAIIDGDLERCGGPAVDLVDSQFCVLKLYTEANGSAATNVGLDTPDDIRIRTGGGTTVPNSDGNIIMGARLGGEPVMAGGSPVTPNNIHVIDGYRTYVLANTIGGKIKLEAGAHYTYVGRQTRMPHPLEDAGYYTEDDSGMGLWKVKASGYDRFSIEALHAEGPLIKSGDGLLRLAGLKGLSSSSVPARNFSGSVDFSGNETVKTVTFPTPESDANYEVFLSVRYLSGSAMLSTPYWSNPTVNGFEIRLPAALGVGATCRLHWLLIKL